MDAVHLRLVVNGAATMFTVACFVSFSALLFAYLARIVDDDFISDICACSSMVTYIRFCHFHFSANSFLPHVALTLMRAIDIYEMLWFMV